jgi:hypothetical protein
VYPTGSQTFHCLKAGSFGAVKYTACLFERINFAKKDPAQWQGQSNREV